MVGGVHRWYTTGLDQLLIEVPVLSFEFSWIIYIRFQIIESDATALGIVAKTSVVSMSVLELIYLLHSGLNVSSIRLD